MEEIENREAEYYLQALDLSLGYVTEDNTFCASVGIS